MNATAELFLDSRCELGEGPSWNGLVSRLFWFDVTNKTLFSATADGVMVDRFIFDEPVTVAGVIDADHLAIATRIGLIRLTLSSDARQVIVPLEPDKPHNRTNDGRISPAGDYWIGTMAMRDPERHATGSLYVVRRGKAQALLTGLKIPNATCFSPDGRTAYFTDSLSFTVRKVALDPATGLPVGEWQDHITVPGPGVPDGAVVDSEGFMWLALYGEGRVVRYTPDGKVDRVVEVPAVNTTCPAFGGPDLKTLYITSARQGLSPEQLEAQPLSGGVFSIRVEVPGQAEHLFKA